MTVRINDDSPLLMSPSGDMPKTDDDNLVLFSGKIVRENGALAFRGPLAHFFLTVAMGKAVWRGKISESEEVCIGIRARDIRLNGDRVSGDINIEGKIGSVLAGVPARRVSVRVENQDVVIRTEKHAGLTADDAVHLHFSRNRALLYRCSIDKINLAMTPVPLEIV